MTVFAEQLILLASNLKDYTQEMTRVVDAFQLLVKCITWSPYKRQS